jgi:hypothetical protein
MQQEAELGRMLHRHGLPSHRVDELFRLRIKEALVDSLEQTDLPAGFGIENPALAGKDVSKLGINKFAACGLL